MKLNNAMKRLIKPLKNGVNKVSGEKISENFREKDILEQTND